MRRAVTIALGVLAAGFVLATAYWFGTPPDRRLAPFPDEDYVRTAETSVEGRAFLAKYAQARATVERGPAVIVDLAVERGARSLHLRFYMDAFQDRVLESFAYCDGKQQPTEVSDYLRSETCLAP